MERRSDHATNHQGIDLPIERQSFFDATRRHRRAARLYGLLVVFGLLLTGLPLAAILFPLLFALAIIGVDLVNLVVPMPDLLAMIDQGLGGGEETALDIFLFCLFICSPGIIALLLVWLCVWRVVLDAGMIEVAQKLGARPPRLEDLEERQLVNVIAEMAIAAGMTPPEVLVLDDPGVNLAAFGPSPAKTTMLVTRGVLDRCDRETTQGGIAHGIAMTSNGDQRLGLLLLSVFAALGLVRHILKAPISRRARGELWALAGFALGPRTKEPAAKAALIEVLLQEDDDPEIDQLQRRRFLSMLLLPFLMAYAFFNLVQFLASLLFLSPTLALLLRRRRYLADATAVQLTRYPSGLQRMLEEAAIAPRLSMPQADQTALMFLHPPHEATAKSSSPFGLMFAVHPPLDKRQKRLARLGATTIAQTDPAHPNIQASWAARLAAALLGALLVPLLAVLIYLMLFLIAAGSMLSVIVGMLWSMVIVMPLDMLLR